MSRVPGGLKHRIGYELKRAQHALRQQMDDALRPLGLTTPQYAALSQLELTPGLSNAELARLAFVTPQTMNAIVAKLETAGLLTRSPHPTHGRVQETVLTEQGRHALAQAHPLVHATEQRMLAGLGDGEQRALLVSLRACTEALQEGG